MTGLTVAVTGPTGEIGRSLIRELEAEPRVAAVRGMSRSSSAGRLRGATKTEYVRGDVAEPADVARLVEGADVVVHLAFAKFADPERARQVNLLGSRNVFGAAVAGGASRLVYTSSVAAYGPGPEDEQPLTELTVPRGSARVMYSAQKAELERALADAVAGSPVAAYTLRPCVVAGPDSLELVTRLPYVLAAEALPEQLRALIGRVPGSPVLPDFGVPLQLVHGDDLAAALAAAVLGEGAPGVYNLPGPGEVTIADLAAELGWRSVRVPRAALDLLAESATRIPRVGERLDWIHLLRRPLLMDAAKARAELGWRPRHEARETLQQTVAEARRRGVIADGPTARRRTDGAPRMRQLSAADTQFLALEDGRNHAHVSTLAIYDASTAAGGRLTLEAITELISKRLHLLPPFRWRLAEVPFGIDYPYWVDDTEFDLDFHIRELALPSPGDERMLTEQVARLVSRPLDRSHPLWEIYLIHGLEHDRVAVLTKFHHAAVDGASGAEILGILLDADPGGGSVPQPDADLQRNPMPSQLRMLGHGLAGVPQQPVRALKAVPKALPHLDQNPFMRQLPGAGAISSISRRAFRARPRTKDGGVLEGRSLHAPRTVVNRPISPHRRLALSSQSLDEIKRIKNHFGVTVNDVVVAICAGALRDWLTEIDELPEQPLVAMIPVSVRTAEEAGTFGNRVSAMLITIPTDEADAGARLQTAHETLRSAKERHAAVPASALLDANNVIPPALLARAARVTTTVAARHPSEAPINTVISNVPGSPVPLYLAGARMEALYPVSAIMDGVGLNLTVMSYDGAVNFGVVVDRALVADPGPLADALRRAQAELLELVPIAEPATTS